MPVIILFPAGFRLRRIYHAFIKYNTDMETAQVRASDFSGIAEIFSYPSSETHRETIGKVNRQAIVVIIIAHTA